MGRHSRAGAVLVGLCAISAAATSCTSAPARAHAAGRPAPARSAVTRPDPRHRPAAQTRPPRRATAVLPGGTPVLLAADVARRLFAAAPVVVVANAGRSADVSAAAAFARAAHAPLLLADARKAGGAAGGILAAAIRDLHPRVVLVVGIAGRALPGLPRTRVVTDPADLPATSVPARLLRHVAVLVHRGDSSAAATSAATTARVAGAALVRVRGNDPRRDPAAITALSAARPREVLAVGAGFGPAGRLASRVAVAATGVQLPGGGQVLFPGHRLVALYGHPGDPALGALGEQGLSASIARARKAAAAYRRLSRVPVIPAFEIIATVAQGSPGADGDYSYESTVASLRPWVRRARAAGMYVVLDLQPGRAGLLSQAKRYAPLLELPGVGLALDPEWKLQPGQLPLQQIGSVGTGAINRVADWLAALTAQHHLPQKLLVLHQFRLTMIRNERGLDTHHDDLAIVIHMDGQGTPAVKQATWNAITRAAPRGVFFGWKNFYVKDHPMLTPKQTMTKRPAPVMISYE